MTRNHLILCLLVFFHTAHGFFYPVPQQYAHGERIELKVNKLTSVVTQLPYNYYSLPVCKPPRIIDSSENLGQILSGDRIKNSLYEIYAMKNVKCKVLCVMNYGESDIKQLSDKVNESYRVHWILDDLPAATASINKEWNGRIIETLKEDKNTWTTYSEGFWLGIRGENADGKPSTHYLHNHHDIKILYHQNPAEYEGLRIVGFEVKPSSVRHHLDMNLTDPNSYPSSCGVYPAPFQELHVRQGETSQIVWTYSVTWEPSSIRWEDRWDRYYANEKQSPVRWFPILAAIVAILGLAAFIMQRKFTVEFYKHSKLDPNEEAEDIGWFSLHSDIFRPPSHPMMLSVLVGSGFQVFATTLVYLLFGIMGSTGPGGMTTMGIVTFAAMGVFSGYISTRLYKQLEGKDLRLNTIMTAVFLPGLTFALFLLINIFLSSQKSSAAATFGTIVTLVALWIMVCVPQVFLGSYFANTASTCANPIRTNPTPRRIPQQPWYLHPIIIFLFGGILPFAAVFVELHFINQALWGHQSYSLLGLLLTVFILLAVLCAETNITIIYFHLSAENHQWWWKPFLISGSSTFYILLYAIWNFTKLEISTGVSTWMYFGYALMMALAFFVLTGSIGFCACYMFIRKMYSSVKRS